MAEQWNEKEIFLAALLLPPEQRDEYLRTVCPDDEFRAQVESLLKHHVEAEGDFLEPSEVGGGGTDEAPDQVDEFRIIRHLGEGGMGVVYLAEDTVLGRQIAIKVLARHLTGSRDALSRFVAEARSAAALNHPGIVPVHKFGFDGRYHYIASEYIDGPTLAEVIEREQESRTATSRSRNTRDWHRRAAEIVFMVAEALEIAHRAGIVHRDVKPSNILIDQDGRARLTDFGIAKQLDEETLKTVVIGSCHYMSPEQASVAQTVVDQRSDIFSLGVVLYEVVALRRPFEGPDVARILRAVASQDPPRLRSVDPLVPKDLETICHKTLEKRPDQRYQSAAHMSADLRCFLEDRPILAKPPSMARRCKHWVRVHRAAVVSVLLVLLVGTLAAFVVTDRQRAHAQWLMERCAVSFSIDQPSAMVYARPYDQATYMPGAPELLGTWPGEPFFVLTGHYRFEIVAPDGSFAEVDCLFEFGGESAVLNASLKPTTAPEGMVLVPAGSYKVGRDSSHAFEKERTVSVPGFWIDVHEVTNAEYFAFVTATGRELPPHWVLGYDRSLDDRPVVGISWEDMQAYVAWAGKRLPTHVEWECAARAPDGRLYPWGEDAGEDRVVLTTEQLDDLARAEWQYGYRVYAALVEPVRARSTSCSALGLYHMLSNVAECTASLIYEQQNTVLVKGGSFDKAPSTWDLSRSGSVLRTASSYRLGFRCARSAAPASSRVKEN